MKKNITIPSDLAVAGVAVIGSSFFCMFAMRKYIKSLESTVRIKNGVIEDAWRNFHLATEKLSADDMLTLLREMKTNSEFNRITLDL